MCLYISKWHHGSNPKPKTAKKDIHVYKVLYDLDNEYYTPFRRALVEFHSNIAISTASRLTILRRSLNIEFSSVDIVTEGIHAYRTILRAKSISNCMGGYIYHAIIPKGTKYYVGIDKNIVSEKLIIFKTKEAFKKYTKKNNFLKLYLL